MQSSIAKLQKFFRLEIERGYDNRAVVGGLDKILPSWENEARANHLSDEVIQSVLMGLQTYPNLEPDGRADLLARLTDLLNQAGASSGDVPSPKEMADPTPDNSLAGNAPMQFSRKTPPRSQISTPEGEPAAHSRKTGAARTYPAETQQGLDAPLHVLQGVGPKLSQTLSSLGLNTLEDLLYYFPRRYDDYSQLKPINRLTVGEETTILGTIQSMINRPIRGGKLQLTEAVVTDGTGFLKVTWFNQPWLATRTPAGTQVVLAGKVEQYLGRPVMNSPEIEPVESEHLHTNRIVPVYSLTARLSQKQLRRIMFQTVTYWAQRVNDYLPERVRNNVKVIGLNKALLNVHFPESQDMLDVARWRLAFDEIFLLQLGVLRMKRTWQASVARVFETPQDWLEQQTARLPFPLTGAQQRAVGEIRSDLDSGRPMERLLQGDVGSGKTAVAALAVAMVTQHGAQAAVMAPTSILAEQHYRSFLRLLAGVDKLPQPVQVLETQANETQPAQEAHLMNVLSTAEIEAMGNIDSMDSDAMDSTFDDESEIDETFETENEVESEAFSQNELSLDESIEEDDQPGEGELPVTGGYQPDLSIEPPLRPEEIRLLVGDTSEAEKQEIREGLENGSIKLVIGTHALIESPVQFKELQLAVIDEQHRFGVTQRAMLRSKGQNPHLLVMTATPIPRSLALTVYGDLDLSVMDEMPPGRQPVGTYILRPVERERAYTLIRSQLDKGHQAFIVYPMVEQGESEDGMPAPNAQLSAVEEHKRLQSKIFPKHKVGLLHGRMKPEEKEEVMKRFRDREYDVLVSTTVVEVGVDVPNATVMLIEGANRFGLAQLHQLRGRVGRGSGSSYCLLIPANEDAVENERLAVMTETNDGFVLAERDLQQRGPGDFLGTRQAGFAELKMANLTDVRLIEKARQQAQLIFQDDPELSAPEHRLLAKKLEQFWGDGRGDVS